MNIIVSGGGTGGHIYPALALIHEIQKHHPDASFLYIGARNGLEQKLVIRDNIPFTSLAITGFKRKLSLENVKTVINFIRAQAKAKRLIHKFNPDVVIGTGGYVCGPVLYAAAKSGVPTVIHEQNSVPGLTNKFLSKYVDKIAVSMKEAAAYFPQEKTVVTGNPRASEILNGDRKKAYDATGLVPGKKTVLIFGGSRGARPINDAVLALLGKIKDKAYQILYVTGDVHYDKVIEEAKRIGLAPNVIIKPFLHNMADVLAVTDLVVSRAGATTIAELTALGLPSILIPSPYVTNNHQEKNARALEKSGAALVITEQELSGERLLSEIGRILTDEERLTAMKTAARKVGIPDAAERLYQVVQTVMNS
ncbi:undecaprenyldiphospho-muramoylpentapeptide beta-N-acetylglucosaminyltransferase [Tuberibacillus calidus]|uniref:undecaprenyldiphospho-muramoylpentapeptide beta-N-acetylglucosaminyltransferase n=1 Tax=Tuberibacillus calidus TaxID=340097 RepID=UPI000403DF7D|nr:undecaprenyldiphospho-muramoylpentapeptide beta-N-acetylglucosaminyltransferase [Tuberibacillus calidus]